MTTLRRAHPSDVPTLYRICLLTGDHGRDATALYPDPELPAHYYAGPYLALEPDLAYVGCIAGVPQGYVLGTADSSAFGRRCETDWFPPLRQRYPLPADHDHSPSAALIRLLHTGFPPEPWFGEYPAHLHIDLLPSLQGRGMGRRLIEVFLEALRKAHVRGVHLGVSRANAGAVGFYRHLGFAEVDSDEHGLVLGMRL